MKKEKISKIKQLQDILSKKNIDVSIFLNFDENKKDKTVYYFSDVEPEFSCLIIPKKGNPKLIVAKLEEELTKKESKIRNVVLLEKDFFKQLSRIIGKNKKIGLNFKTVSLSEKKLLSKHLKKSKFFDVSNDITDLRIQKTDDEIDKIRKACKITDEIFSKIILNAKSFRNEKEIEELIENEAKKNGCSLAFSPIVGSGKNSSMPHYKDNNSEIKKGFCVIDFGVRYQGYNSDITRTIYFGTPSEKEKEEYYRLLGVQEEAIKKIKVGEDFKKIDKAVRKVLGDSFIHSLGHGLGIDVHERVSTDNKRSLLKDGTILTVEPGVYHTSKFGIRIEDDVLVTKRGNEILTKSSKKLIIIKIT